MIVIGSRRCHRRVPILPQHNKRRSSAAAAVEQSVRSKIIRDGGRKGRGGVDTDVGGKMYPEERVCPVEEGG